ncbi:MAG: 4Fe-4S binding protein, partial [Spirochaetaceae bacterium]|nr:4Fe-4S binding protein [Spirochaetaceae bacterium]
PAGVTTNAKPRRQGLRRLVGLISLLAFPVTMNWMSPAVSQFGAWSGVVAGSVLFFAALFASALFLGRGFCGWVCPAGAVGDLLRPLKDKRVRKGRWVKFVVWGLWFVLLVFGFHRNRPLTIDPLFFTESGVSVSEPRQYIIYGMVVAVFIVLALSVGRRGACHTVCWMAPFMMAGRATGNFLKIPALRLRSKPERCTACGSCVAACPMSLNVTKMVKGGRPESLDCALCGECVDLCPEEALKFGFGLTLPGRSI